MLKGLKEWIEERWPLSFLVRLALEEEITGGARYVYALGSTILIVFTIQAVTGIMQLFFYVPSTDHAYDSLSYLRTRVPFGWLIHGLHYWGAQVMVTLVLLHVTRVFIWGAYKKPRELTWLAGVALLLTTMAFIFTGTPLQWDQRGYLLGKVSTGIAGAVPVVGGFIKIFLRGGDEMGQAGLSRLFGLHVAVLPLTLVALFGIHIVAMRRFGPVGPWDDRRRTFRGAFWPDQVFKDAVTGTAVFFLLIVLTVFLPPSYTGPADPLDTSYIPRPEWNFLFLYEAFTYFEGRLEPVGIVGVPSVLVLILVLLPFIDRNPGRDPLKRPFAMAGALVLAALILALTARGYLNPLLGRVPSEQRSDLPEKAPQPAPAAEKRLHPILEKKGPPGPAAYIIGSVERGAASFAKHCSSCHGPLGKSITPNRGSLEGKVPDLNPIHRDLFDEDAQTFAENIDRFIQHGSTPAGTNPAIRMPAFGDMNTLTQQEIANVESYLLSLNGIDRAQIVEPGIEPRKFFVISSALYILTALALGGLRGRRYSP